MADKSCLDRLKGADRNALAIGTIVLAIVSSPPLARASTPDPSRRLACEPAAELTVTAPVEPLTTFLNQRQR